MDTNLVEKNNLVKWSKIMKFESDLKWNIQYLEIVNFIKENTTLVYWFGTLELDTKLSKRQNIVNISKWNIWWFKFE